MNDFTAYDNFEQDVIDSVARALSEDIGDGDITAQLIPADKMANASVITKEDAVICGRPWVDEVFKQIDPNIVIEWRIGEGDKVKSGTELFKLKGNARALLTGERAALNFLQSLSGTATLSAEYAALTKDMDLTILDTRKTIPGLRLAQKYAVQIGGCDNHRIGLYDAFLIKENHIMGCGSIEAAVKQARAIAPNKPVEIEVETIEELQQALNAKADIVMLDNFSMDNIKQMNDLDLGQTKIEVSGNLDAAHVKKYAGFKVDYLSSGALTKHLHAIDLSMRFTDI